MEKRLQSLLWALCIMHDSVSLLSLGSELWLCMHR